MVSDPKMKLSISILTVIVIMMTISSSLFIGTAESFNVRSVDFYPEPFIEEPILAKDDSNEFQVRLVKGNYLPMKLGTLLPVQSYKENLLRKFKLHRFRWTDTMRFLPLRFHGTGPVVPFIPHQYLGSIHEWIGCKYPMSWYNPKS